VLERWTGCELFERSRGSTPRLSAEGTALLSQARELTASRRGLRLPRPERAAAQGLTLRIAAGAYLLENYIRPALPRILEQHPNLHLDFLPTGMSVKDMQRAVQSGAADIAVFNGRRSVRQFAGAQLIGETPCSLYVSTRLTTDATKDARAIALLPFVLPPEGSAMERWMLYLMKTAHVSPVNVVARSQFMDVLGGMVLSGRGVSVLFDEQMTHHVRAGRVLRLAPAIESCSLVLLAGQRARKRATAPFVKLLYQVLKSRGDLAG
jgi:DNA-binding transcriptional LysR family regulator